MCGALSTAFVSLLASFYYGFNDPTTISPELITPLLRKRIFRDHHLTIAQGKAAGESIKDTEF